MNIIYHTDIKGYTWRSIEKHLSKLPDTDKSNILCKKKEKDRCLTLLGRMLLFYILNKYEHINSDIANRISFNEYGKPYIKGMKGHFNISHSGTIVACGYSDGVIGIDIEKIAPLCLEDFKCALTGEEYHLLKSGDPKEIYPVWTQKEALVKAVGKGFYYDPADINLGDNLKNRNFIINVEKQDWHIYTYDKVPGYILSIASGKADTPVVNELAAEMLI